MLKEKIKIVPETPGVYLLKDDQGQIIYVGKAKRLKQRLQTYFRSGNGQSPKVQRLMRHFKDFDYIMVDTEFEALMLECQLIQQIQPMYNRLMKNPASFSYVEVDRSTKRYQVKVATDKERKQSGYFGPYTRIGSVEEALASFKKSFQMDCSNHGTGGVPCINYGIGLCNGSCFDKRALAVNNERINRLYAFLSAQSQKILHELEEKMTEASTYFQFEQAAMHRDTIAKLTNLAKKEAVIAFTEEDHLLLTREKITNTLWKIFLMKRTSIKMGYVTSLSETDISHLLAFICQERKKPRKYQPINKQEIDAANIIYQYASRKNCNALVITNQTRAQQIHSFIKHGQ